MIYGGSAKESCMKKILLVNSVCSVGSTGRIVKNLYEEAVRCGYRCKIAYGRGIAEGIPSSDAYLIGNRCSLWLSAARTRMDDREGFHCKAQTRRFLSFVDEFAPDVIHLHNLHGYYINLPMLFEYLGAHSDIKVVWTLHDCWAFTGHCAYFIDCMKWKNGCRECPRKAEYPASRFVDNSKQNYIDKKRLFALPKNSVIVTPSEWLSQLVGSSFLSVHPIKTVHNGIDLSQFKPTSSDIRKKHSLDGKKLLIAVASRWTELKGIEDIIALRRLLDDSFVIALVGETVSGTAIPHSGIIRVPHTDSIRELAEWYTAADYFINPTHDDNFPTVNLESLACGTPVITYKTGGSPESIDVSCGAVTEENTPEAMADLLRTLPIFNTDDCLERSKMFEKSHALKGYIDIYAQ